MLRESTCVVCGKPSVLGFTHSCCLGALNPERLISVFNYEGAVRSAILASKFAGKTFSYLEYLCNLSAPLVKSSYACIPKTCRSKVLAVPIPLSKKRYAERGFNQAEIIAKMFAKTLEVGCTTNLLVKSLETVDQATTATKSDRKKNVKSIFAVSEKFVDLKAKMLFDPSSLDIILIDDVCTTGATLLSATLVLKEFGFRHVWCVTIAKTPALEEYYYNI